MQIKGLSDLLLALSSKACISDGMGCISVYRTGILHICKGTINAERCTWCLKQHMLPSRQCLFHAYFIQTMLTHMAPQQKSPGAGLVCLQSRPFISQRYLAYHETLSTVQTACGTTWSPQFPDVYRLLLKEEGMLLVINMPLSIPF